MEVVNNLVMLLVSIRFLCSLTFVSPQNDSRSLDILLQDYAYRAFGKLPKTGAVYDGTVPSNLTGIRVSTLRLRNGSLRKRGFSMYKEFAIPQGLIVHPYVERLALVYQNIGNWSMTYYPLQGYTYLAPVLGLLAYNASNLTAQNLPKLDLYASGQPISIKFSGLRRAPHGSIPKCISFDLNGSFNFSDVMSGNMCTTFRQGHFSIVVEQSNAPSPSPSPSLSPVPMIAPKESGKSKKGNKKTWIIVGSVIGGLLLLVLFGLFMICARKYARKKKMYRMERAAEAGEALHMTTVGSTRAPSATGTRTQPNIETEYIP